LSRVGFRVLAVVTVFGLSACSAVLDTVESEDLPADRENYLVRIGMIENGENVRFFTSGGVSFEEAGHLFTDVRVGSYWLPDHAHEEDKLESILLADVTSIEFTDLDTWTYADYVTVTPAKGPAMKVYLPGSDGFPERFYDALSKQWKKTKAQK
jgi:hypothetical protein